MTRHPVSDSRSVVAEPPKRAEVERFFACELAKYLRVSRHRVGEVARKRRIDRYVGVQSPVRFLGAVALHMWVDRRGARLIIEHFRAMQGQMYEEGRDWDVERAKRQAIRKARTAKERAEKQAKAARGQIAALAPSAPTRDT